MTDSQVPLINETVLVPDPTPEVPPFVHPTPLTNPSRSKLLIFPALLAIALIIGVAGFILGRSQTPVITENPSPTPIVEEVTIPASPIVEGGSFQDLLKEKCFDVKDTLGSHTLMYISDLPFTISPSFKVNTELANGQPAVTCVPLQTETDVQNGGFLAIQIGTDTFFVYDSSTGEPGHGGSSFFGLPGGLTVDNWENKGISASAMVDFPHGGPADPGNVGSLVRGLRTMTLPSGKHYDIVTTTLGFKANDAELVTLLKEHTETITININEKDEKMEAIKSSPELDKELAALTLRNFSFDKLFAQLSAFEPR